MSQKLTSTLKVKSQV